MNINHIKIYKGEVNSAAWNSYLSLEHSQKYSDQLGEFLVFHTVPKQTKSEVYTVSSYSLDKHHPLLWHLEEGVQEEHMLDMTEVIEELKQHQDYYEDFLLEVDTTADNCLLIKAW